MTVATDIPALVLGLDTIASALVPGVTALVVKESTPGIVKGLVNVLICLVYSIIRVLITNGGTFTTARDYVWAILYVMILSESLYVRFKDQYSVFQQVGPVSDKAVSFANALTQIYDQLAKKETTNANLSDPVEGKS